MNCRRAARLRSYGKDHTLSHRDRAALQSHLADCADCRRQEEGYHQLVSALRIQQEAQPRVGLFEQALQQSRTPFKEGHKERTMVVRLGITTVAIATFATILLGTRAPKAYGQEALAKMQTAVGQVNTLHIVSWELLPTEEEIKDQSWNENKKPIRLEGWITRTAICGWDESNGPHLWTSKGYMSYDPSAKQVTLQDLGPGMRLTDAIHRAFNPISTIKETAPTGTYLSVKSLGNALWRGRDTYKLQIASGPQKPASGEEVTTPQTQGVTPPLSQSPQVRQTFWVDKANNLPVYSEYEKQIQQRWIVIRRSEYEYNRPVPAQMLDPAAVRKAAHAYVARQKKP
jgi:hypothetical protein